MTKVLATAIALLATACAPGDRMDWIRLKPVGAQDKPFPTIWMATQQLPVSDPFTHPFNHVLVLSLSDYQHVIDNVRNLQCRRRTADPYNLEFGTTEVAESVGGKESVHCVLSRAETCAFLPKLQDSVVSDTALIQDLSDRIGCKHGP